MQPTISRATLLSTSPASHTSLTIPPSAESCCSVTLAGTHGGRPHRATLTPQGARMTMGTGQKHRRPSLPPSFTSPGARCNNAPSKPSIYKKSVTINLNKSQRDLNFESLHLQLNQKTASLMTIEMVSDVFRRFGRFIGSLVMDPTVWTFRWFRYGFSRAG